MTATPSPADLVKAALDAKTTTDASHVQALIGQSFGARHRRPVGDKWNNHGLMSTSGSFDLKLIENVTNMQDAVIERRALAKWGRREDVPYDSPQAAVEDLFRGVPEADRSWLATVTFEESDRPTGTTKRLTPVFRDKGCGMRPDAVPSTIFGLGDSNKDNALYQQGAFGLGGAMTFRNARAVILVTRRDPALLAPGEEDVIAVAVVQWQESTKGSTAFYLVDSDWQRAGDPGQPWSCPAAEVPDFEVGTHLALVSYRVDGFHRKKEGDERTFDTVTNTRLFKPVLPVRFTNMIARGADRSTTLRGLDRRLESTEHELSEGDELLPFLYGNKTYHLPVRYVLFAKTPGEAGGRRSFLAHEHAVLFLSNGQTHHHWTPQQFRAKTSLNKLDKRILVVVETDVLPIRVRTGLFTADRSELVRGDAALRLEENLKEFLNSWDALRDENNEAIRAALTGTGTEPTLAAARKISRALNMPGFGFAGTDGGGGSGESRDGGRGRGSGGGGGGRPKSVELHSDPTTITGPATAQARLGHTRWITYYVDAVDQFFQGRGELTVTCDHPQIPTTNVVVGKGNKGRVRVGVTVPEDIDLGIHELRVSLTGWTRAGGGLGPDIPEHVTKLEVVEDIIPGGTSGTTGPGEQSGGPSQGSSVALKWSNRNEREDWSKMTVGEVMPTPAHVLAGQSEDYADLAPLGDLEIPTVILNADFPALKTYLAGRSKQLDALDVPKERYAVGVGIALLLLQDSVNHMDEEDRETDSVQKMLRASQDAAAKAVLAVMPAFDELSKAAGLDNEDDETG